MHSGLERAIIYDPKMAKKSYFWPFLIIFRWFLVILTPLTAIYPRYPPGHSESPGETGQNGVFLFPREVLVFGGIFFPLLYKGLKSEILEFRQKILKFSPFFN